MARRGNLLDNVKSVCLSHHVEVNVYVGDVTDEAFVVRSIQSFQSQFGSLGIVFANAGIGAADPIWRGESESVHRVINTNIRGVVNTVFAATPIMVKQQSGKIIVISSIAAFRGLPRHGAYSGSKIAIRTMVDGWRYDLVRNNIQITTIHPGFIKTPLVNNNRLMPFLMDVDLAIKKIISAVDAGKKSYIFPWQWRWVILLSRIIPDWLIQKVYFNKKAA